MSIQHKSLRDEILFVVGRSSGPLTSDEIYERVELADEMKQVSNALFQLTAAGKLRRIGGEGRVRYALADGVAAPAPSGKAGRPADAPAEAPAAAPTPEPVPQTGKASEPGTKGLADAVILADAIIAKLRKQLGEQAIQADMLRNQLREQAIQSELLETSPAPAIHIHIEQVDIHLGGL